MAGGPQIRRVGLCCSSTRGRVAARPHGPGLPSGRGRAPQGPAEVSGRIVRNNVSLGIHGEGGSQAGLSRSQGAYAARRPLLRRCIQARRPALRLTDDLGREHRHLAVVLVPNNPHALDRPLPKAPSPTLDIGQLGIVIPPPGRLAISAPPRRRQHRQRASGRS